MQLTDCALDFARESAGRSIPAKMAMMAITTSSSMSVKARSKPANGEVALEVERRLWVRMLG
jgi:hypothetical protein